MTRSSGIRTLCALALAGAVISGDTAANAGGEPAVDCRVMEVDMTPDADLQIVVWLEDGAGQFVDTLFITRLTGSFGLGNRPGRMDFNSEWRWPYGRRTATFPVWANRHGLSWPLVVFQNGDDSNLSHPLGQSSPEIFYCRPLIDGEPMSDAQSCASTVYTDKGVMSTTETSLYPPRTDVKYTPGTDDPVVEEYPELNPFDAISRPTPPGGEAFRLAWSIPQELPDGDYVLWVEVAKEFDMNATYNESTYPPPGGIPWSEYGLPYRGQPSVVYRVPVAIMNGESRATTAEFAGYGDPDGLDGDVRVPDTTITTGVPGSGASRLLLTDDGAGMYRVSVIARRSDDSEVPGYPREIRAVEVSQEEATISFLAPGDDDDVGLVSRYEIRYLIGDSITAENFESATPATASVTPLAPGSVQTVTIEELSPRTNYSIGVRALDECGNVGGLAVANITTPERESGTVDACFVATAAYGSLLEADVEMLRRFRDRYLRTHVTGEILVEGYYTFGPALAKLIAPSETLREAARAGLAPIADAIRDLAPAQ